MESPDRRRFPGFRASLKDILIIARGPWVNLRADKLFQQAIGSLLTRSRRLTPKKPAMTGRSSSSGSRKPFSQHETVPCIRWKTSSQPVRGMPFFSLRILNFVPNGIGFHHLFFLRWLKYNTRTLK